MSKIEPSFIITIDNFNLHNIPLIVTDSLRKCFTFNTYK